jgi:histidine triad (HIT) family protein
VAPPSLACVFCAIIAGAKSARLVAETESSVAFLDARPLFPGHVLVVPRVHVETLLDVDPAALGPFFTLVQRVARAVETGLGADGVFVANNNRVSQSVPHLHVHVIPRHKKDGLRGFFWPRHPYANDEEADRVRAAIAAAFI